MNLINGIPMAVNNVLGNIYKDDFADILKRRDNNFICPYDYHCELLCQRRYD